uniref:Uncharacterized protein n=1 Tax=Cucumis melo TaxID=3656 RepID=A0A9I9EIZ7_CUCME
AFPILHHCASPRSTKLQVKVVRTPQTFPHSQSPHVLAPQMANVPPLTFAHGRPNFALRTAKDNYRPSCSTQTHSHSGRQPR